MNDEKIIEYLKECGLYYENNLYFIGKAVTTVVEFQVGDSAMHSNQYSDYIINQTEMGIGIIPVDKITKNVMYKMGVLLPPSQMNSVAIEKVGLFTKFKITITNILGQKLILICKPKNSSIKKHNQNLALFLQMYRK